MDVTDIPFVPISYLFFQVSVSFTAFGMCNAAGTLFTGRYVGSRPIKLRKSSWKQRNMESVRKKEKEKTALIGLLTGR